MVQIKTMDSGARLIELKERQALPLSSCMTLGKLLKFSVPHFPHLTNGDNKSSVYFPRLFEDQMRSCK